MATPDTYLRLARILHARIVHHYHTQIGGEMPDGFPSIVIAQKVQALFSAMGGPLTVEQVSKIAQSFPVIDFWPEDIHSPEASAERYEQELQDIARLLETVVPDLEDRGALPKPFVELAENIYQALWKAEAGAIDEPVERQLSGEVIRSIVISEGKRMGREIQPHNAVAVVGKLPRVDPTLDKEEQQEGVVWQIATALAVEVPGLAE